MSFRITPATVIALLALFVAIGGTAMANRPAGGEPTASASKAIGTYKLKVRSGTTLIKGAKGTGKYGTGAVEAKCRKGETALSSGTNFSDDRNNRELTTVYNRLTVNSRGKPTGARARGGIDSGGVGFTVYVLCAG